ncbi:MAG: hypothetical protein A2Z72_07475 [Omnitrophica bacterium RBG_13_46_9]|nr:MAG: hypothetical protein A2Z72_07475 [Omnitrophica bacterium RBG_13_46_9]
MGRISARTRKFCLRLKIPPPRRHAEPVAFGSSEITGEILVQSKFRKKIGVLIDRKNSCFKAYDFRL